ncbi:MaoC family dehydratase N-terminal domain-containing protein [Cellulomonas sp. PhB143]|uniref:FAS1-like dehydratase domain-containing protein n=1 Tax=Cellulomonas sp. PhB143 TaxID=2485186 RepID=UPI000F4643DF|nr:MaoC family dehydratase N-terminal domain-containing protein [Cellulomonas sp. PhB143]ROS76750.1 acyl dehydratase [Cellulomonas sp. PhB143]
MTINTDYAGREYPATAPYSVGREALRELAATLGSLHPAHHDLVAARGAGYPDLVAPPTYAVVLAQRAEAQLVQDEAAGIDFSRVVHAEERFTHHRPIVAGDELVTVLHVDSIVERRGLAMVTTRCEISAADGGEPVATVVSTLAVRGEVA